MTEKLACALTTAFQVSSESLVSIWSSGIHLIEQGGQPASQVPQAAAVSNARAQKIFLI